MTDTDNNVTAIGSANPSLPPVSSHTPCIRKAAPRRSDLFVSASQLREEVRMLKVTIELLPSGFAPMRRTIASMHISNATDLADISDYVVEAVESANPLTRTPARKGSVVLYHHDRQQSVWALLARAASEIERADFVEL